MMSMSPQLPLQITSPQNIGSPAPILANGIGSGELATNEEDDRSSSLSDIEDRTANAEPGLASRSIGGGSEVNDTEAETERLEDSPQKAREHKNVVLGSSNNGRANTTDFDSVSAIGSPHGLGTVEDPNERYVVRKADTTGARIDQNSEISSLEDSSEDVEKLLPRANAKSRKRKRQSPRSDSQSEGEKTETMPKTNVQPILSQAPTRLISAIIEPKIENSYADNDFNSGTNDMGHFEIEVASSHYLSPSKTKGKKGKRKAKKTKYEDPERANTAAVGHSVQKDQVDIMEQVDSNGDDAETEDIADSVEPDLAARTEEGLMKKKSAMDSLGAIEKCFATLRDKLFDERLAQYNDELAMLGQTSPSHPEYLAQKEIVDRHRDEKIDYEETLFKYKLIALQKKSIAEKAQIHSQYMQSVREIRDRNLEQLNREWYQVQRERRSCENSEPEYAYKFSTRRSQQIRQQTAYNNEVSILSGVAKYVGFPAAPDIMKARPKEIEDDLAGIAAAMNHTNTQTSKAVQRQPSSPRANPSSGIAGFPRQKPAAEERFLEQNPWANPQHPAHHQQQHPAQRQIPHISRPSSPFSTPAGQRRIVDLTAAQGSASTVAEPQSGPGSSTGPTPATDERTGRVSQVARPSMTETTSAAPPSRLVETPSISHTPGSLLAEVRTERAKDSESSTVGVSEASSGLGAPGQDVSRISHDLKSSVSNSGITLSSPTNPPSSSQTRYAVVKAGDTSQLPHPSPTLVDHEHRSSNRIPANGNQERFGIS